MATFRAFDPSDAASGMSRGGHLDRVVFERFVGNRDELRQLASTLRAGAANPGLLPADPVEDEEESEEGRLVFRS
jgi:hypothetical protein